MTVSPDHRIPESLSLDEIPSLPAKHHGGGPGTVLGRACSRQNSLKHGLTAQSLLPEVLGDEILERFKQRFFSEWQPNSVTQELLITEMARHAAALEKAQQFEAAVLRRAARSIVEVCPDLAGDKDGILAAAVGTEQIDRLTKYRRAHEKGLYAALVRLQELKAQGAVKQPAAHFPLQSLDTESGCENYLIGRRQKQGQACLHCGSSAGYWLAKRRHWQCADCNRQVGLRAGTVMAGSHLPLRIWFIAIQHLLCNPGATLAQLAAATGVRRPATLRRVAESVREAMESPRMSDRLVGLDQMVAVTQLPDKCVLDSAIFPKRTFAASMEDKRL
jgi:hypothetical protein